MLSPENRHGNGESLFLDTRYIFIHGCFSIVMLVFMGLVFFLGCFSFLWEECRSLRIFFLGGNGMSEKNADMKTSRFAADG